MADNVKIYNEENSDVEELLPIKQLASEKLSASHIRLLLRSGKIKGKKIGRDWFCTKEAIEKYLQLGVKPGPKQQE